MIRIRNLTNLLLCASPQISCRNDDPTKKNLIESHLKQQFSARCAVNMQWDFFSFRFPPENTRVLINPVTGHTFASWEGTCSAELPDAICKQPCSSSSWSFRRSRRCKHLTKGEAKCSVWIWYDVLPCVFRFVGRPREMDGLFDRIWWMMTFTVTEERYQLSFLGKLVTEENLIPGIMRSWDRCSWTGYCFHMVILVKVCLDQNGFVELDTRKSDSIYTHGVKLLSLHVNETNIMYGTTG